MPVYIRIIISGADFLDYSKDLLNKYGIHCYIEYRDKKKRAFYEKINLSKSFSDVFNEKYSCFFFSTKELNAGVSINFYSDELFPHSIEVNGGRENDTEIEQLDLRIISKLPDDSIRLFFNALNNKLKKDANFGKGVHIKDYFNNTIFYKKGLQKIIWGSFERKQFLNPIELP